MTASSREFYLSRNIEHYLAVLSKMYTQEGESTKLEVIVNSNIRVSEEWTNDNWNNTYGHALFLDVPEPVYLRVVKYKDDICKTICKDINKIHNVPNEWIDEVFIEMEMVEDRDWRKESGALLSSKRIITPKAQSRIWGDERFRIFLSHKTEVKKQTASLKKCLQKYGASCFVAHQDIHPTKEWQNEIENALFSMDAFVALLTEDFHSSLWTDQEVGVAFGRGVPILAIRLGLDPYGFIGKFQALSCTWDTAPMEIMSILIQNDRMLDAFISATSNCESYDDGNTLAEMLPCIKQMSEEQAERLVEIYNDSSQLRGSFGFNGTKPSHYGAGLLYHLERLTGQNYRTLGNGKKIERR